MFKTFVPYHGTSFGGVSSVRFGSNWAWFSFLYVFSSALVCFSSGSRFVRVEIDVELDVIRGTTVKRRAG